MTKKDDGKNVAIISYITIIGWIIALIMNNQQKSDMGSYHIRQTLLIYILSIAVSWIPVIGWVVAIVLFIFWIMGLVAAINGEKKELPLIGAWAQEWFKGL